MCRLFVLDKNTLNNTNVRKSFVLDKNTNVCKFVVLDKILELHNCVNIIHIRLKKNWNHTTVFKLFVLDKNA